MKTILCYGDSNTWGYKAFPAGGRYAYEIRWTGLLQSYLGKDFLVAEDGLNGRTTIFPDPEDPWRNGETLLVPALNRTRPLDLLILMLGTNDLKLRFGASPSDIARGMGRLARLSRTHLLEKDGAAPEILIISPPAIQPRMQSASFAAEYGGDAAEQSRELAGHYRSVAEELGCLFLDAAAATRSMGEDGVHLSPEGHRALAAAIYARIQF